MSSTSSVLGCSLCAHVRRRSAAGTALYIKLDNSDLSRIGLRHGQTVELDLGRVSVGGIVKTSGGSPWLAPNRGSSNAAITAALRAAGFEHGMDVRSSARVIASEAIVDTSSVPAPSRLYPAVTAPSSSRLPDGASDHERLVVALRQLAPSVRPSADRAWQREAAVRVIDCVLSLNRKYDLFVVPRLDRFEQNYPSVRMVSDLYAEMMRYSSPSAFVTQALDYRHADRAMTLWSVVKWLITVSGTGTSAEQLANLQNWAVQAQPNDYLSLHIGGFGLAGFQYLRMLFGANTTKPDIHIRRFVESCVGHSVSEIDALQLLERAATEAALVLRDLDTTIWEESAR